VVQCLLWRWVSSVLSWILFMSTVWKYSENDTWKHKKANLAESNQFANIDNGFKRAQGSDAPARGREDDALGIMEHLNEDNAAAYCEAEEVLASLPSAVCMASPHSQYRTRTNVGQSPHDCKENMRNISVDGGTSSSFVNWLPVSCTILHFGFTWNCCCYRVEAEDSVVADSDIFTVMSNWVYSHSMWTFCHRTVASPGHLCGGGRL
jgi:hypothetical protein